MALCTHHSFESEDELCEFRAELLSWYSSNCRDLPWRRKVVQAVDPNVRGYAVWVSEVMLQQTQVATVVDYYNRWMEKWPTVESLAAASLEEVKEMWSGLGYYSRARRLLEAAKKVVVEMGGQLPQTAAELMRLLPGVGRYTASAIASIAYGEECGVVDGNVVRVWSRVKTVGAVSSSSAAINHFWQLSSEAVVGERPGDFNQALMELGATVCTPKSPHCASCPVRSHCGALLQVKKEKSSLNRLTAVASLSDQQPLVEPPTTSHCPLCLPLHQPWDIRLGVMSYPRKEKRKKTKEEHFSVGVIETSKPIRFLIQRRQATGLLAGLWEFPSVAVKPDCPVQTTWQPLQQHLSLTAGRHTFLGTVSHQFSHTLHHYHVWHLITPSLPNVIPPSPHKWVTGPELLQSAISTAVRKIYRLVTGPQRDSGGGGVEGRKRGRGKGGDTVTSKRQKTLDSFLH